MIPLAVIYRLDADESGYSPVGALDDAYSVVWTERWQDYGEAQIRAPPGCPAEVGDLVSMVGRSMSAEIVGRTETERGVELRCKDALSVLDRRIVYPMVSNDGLVSTFITKMLQTDGIVGDGTQTGDRALKPVRIGDLSAVTASARVQRTFQPMGEALLALGRTYGFDPVASLAGKHIAISARTNATSREWMLGGGLASFEEDEDVAQWKNVAYVAAQQDADGQRIVASIGSGAGMGRRELHVDRRDLPMVGMGRTTFESVWGPITSGTAMIIWVRCEGESQPFAPADMKIEGEVMAGGIVARAEVASAVSQVNTDLIWAMLDDATPYLRNKWYMGIWNGAGWDVAMETQTFAVPLSVLDPAVFSIPRSSWDNALESYGLEALADLQPETAFGASVEGLVPYVDYALGDTVRIIKRPGDWRTVRIAEIVESWDSQGYRATPNLANI